jgi:hypothetical protein
MQQPLIMGEDDQDALVAAQAVDTSGDDSQRIALSRPAVM